MKKVPRLGGVGVFARKSLTAGTEVTRYMGETMTLVEGERRDRLRLEVVLRSRVFLQVLVSVSLLPSVRTR